MKEFIFKQLRRIRYGNLSNLVNERGKYRESFTSAKGEQRHEGRRGGGTNERAATCMSSFLVGKIGQVQKEVKKKGVINTKKFATLDVGRLRRSVDSVLKGERKNMI